MVNFGGSPDFAWKNETDPVGGYETDPMEAYERHLENLGEPMDEREEMALSLFEEQLAACPDYVETRSEAQIAADFLDAQIRAWEGQGVSRFQQSELARLRAERAAYPATF